LLPGRSPKENEDWGQGKKKKPKFFLNTLLSR
jgi:hypothetical protein